MTKTSLTAQDTIKDKILVIRGKKVMLDRDLAMLYDVETKYLKRQVNRNIERFPDDFMFQLNRDEFNNLRSQIGTSSWGGIRYLSYAFTELGVAMLSSVLRSKEAIQVNIQIMRTFTMFREMISTHKDLQRKIEAMERKYDGQFKIVFSAIKKLLEQPVKAKGRIGFK